ncbi:MAG: T9SS type A sorting domain-containing protein [Candidatus Delongbacteria bacterium]|nr:T9SS type A sorting domain-containing protein [Candidatus Delongbacteria bacterium]MBN2836700.1 T9SS type A sorting domain-containing protein [Candidatus Delongbacteria bacterium]
MKSFVTIFTMVLFFVTASYSNESLAGLSKGERKIKEVKRYLDRQEGISKDGEFPTVLNDDVFSQSLNGFGWCSGFNHKVDYDPVSQSYGSFYRATHVTGSGSGGFSYAELGDDSFDNGGIVYTNPPAMGGLRYPYITSGFGYHFCLGTFYGDGELVKDKIMLIVYDVENIESTEPIYVGQNEEFCEGWMVAGDITMNSATGEYILLITAEKGINSEPFQGAVIIGKTLTPMDPSSWEFSDYNDLLFVAGGNIYDAENFKPFWGSNGFGVVAAPVAVDMGGVGITYPGYIYTEDWGATWILKDNTTFFTNVDEYCNSFTWNGTLTSDGKIIRPKSWAAFDGFIDANNNFHWVSIANGSTYESTSYIIINADGDILDGYYDTTIENITGNQNVSYTSDYLAVRHFLFDPAETAESTPYYGNELTLSVGCSENYPNDGYMYVTYVDRILGETGVDLNLLNFSKPQEIYDVQPYFLIKSANGFVESDTFVVDDQEFSHGYCLVDDVTKSYQGFASPSIVPSTNSVNSIECIPFSVYQIADLTTTPNQIQDYASYGQVLHSIYYSKVGLTDDIMPLENSIVDNYPNPFNPTTDIRFVANANADIKFRIFNANGELISELVKENCNEGLNQIHFDGSKLNSGVYFYQMISNGLIKGTEKMVLTK